MTRPVVLWSGVAVGTAVALVLAVVWWTRGAPADEPLAASPANGGVPVLSAILGGSGPGSMISATTMPGLSDVVARRMIAARVVYRSTSGDGSPTVVSGSVFIPQGAAPDGGWPVVSLGHGTTGLGPTCAPSASDSLLGYEGAVGGLVRRGYAVALADYQGLGSRGVHPYTDARTAGRNMIDAVRALRATFRSVSTRWGAFGGSEGGGASWAADEQASTYAPELEFVGAVAVSPTANLTGLVERAERGELTEAQRILLSGIIKSLSLLHPDVKRDDYRPDGNEPGSDADIPCSGPGSPADAVTTRTPIKPDVVAPTSPAAAHRLRNYLADWALPQRPLSGPLYVWYGGADPFVDASWTADAIRRVCDQGGIVDVVFEPDKGHGEINYTDQFNWLTNRFEGGPVANACA